MGDTSTRTDLDRIGELVARHDRERTHWDHCCYAHLTCAIVALGAEVRQLRGAEEVIASWQQIANDERAEVERLRAGIAHHRGDIDEPMATAADRALWTLLTKESR